MGSEKVHEEYLTSMRLMVTENQQVASRLLLWLKMFENYLKLMNNSITEGQWNDLSPFVAEFKEACAKFSNIPQVPYKFNNPFEPEEAETE